jgi:hypothetical protein
MTNGYTSTALKSMLVTVAEAAPGSSIETSMRRSSVDVANARGPENGWIFLDCRAALAGALPPQSRALLLGDRGELLGGDSGASASMKACSNKAPSWQALLSVKHFSPNA